MIALYESWYSAVQQHHVRNSLVWQVLKPVRDRYIASFGVVDESAQSGKVCVEEVFPVTHPTGFNAIIIHKNTPDLHA